MTQMRALLVLGVLTASCKASAPASPPPAEEAAQIVVHPDPVTLAAGGSAQLAVQVNDAIGRPIGGAPITFQSSDPGVVQVSPHGLVTAPRRTGTAKIVVSSGTRSTAAAVTVTAGAPARLMHLEGDGQSGQVTSALPGHLRVRVLDDNGNAVGQAPVRFQAGGSGTIAPAEARSADDGTAEASWILGPAAGSQSATASSGERSTSFQATAQAGAPVRIVAVGSPPAAAAGGATLHVKALVTDAHGNPAPGTQVVWSVRGGKGTVAPASGSSDAAGTAETRWTLGKRGQRNSLRATLAVDSGITVDFVVDAR